MLRRRGTNRFSSINTTMCLILSVEVAPAVASDARAPAAQTSTHKMTHAYSFLESAIAVDGSGDEVTEPMLVVVSALVSGKELSK